MNTFFQINPARTIVAAYENRYDTAICHPDRILKDHDFVYISEGEWTIEQNGISYPLKKDDVILLTAGEHHGGRKPCKTGTKTLFLHAEGLEGERLSEDVQKREHQIPIPIVTHCQSNYQIKDTFYHLISAFAVDANAPYRAERLDTLFRTLLFQLYDTAYHNLSGSGANHTVHEILYLIHHNSRHFYTDNELSELFFASGKTIVQKFRAYTGMTPYRYQMHYKLENIKAILQNEPEQTLKELSQTFGFYDEFHLSHCFKKFTGVSPTEYKKKLTGARSADSDQT